LIDQSFHGGLDLTVNRQDKTAARGHAGDILHAVRVTCNLDLLWYTCKQRVVILFHSVDAGCLIPVAVGIITKHVGSQFVFWITADQVTLPVDPFQRRIHLSLAGGRQVLVFFHLLFNLGDNVRCDKIGQNNISDYPPSLGFLNPCLHFHVIGTCQSGNCGEDSFLVLHLVKGNTDFVNLLVACQQVSPTIINVAAFGIDRPVFILGAQSW